MLSLYKYLRGYIPALIAAVALLLGQAMCDLALPNAMSGIVNRGIVQGDTDYIAGAGLLMLGISLLGACCSISVGWIGARTAASLGQRLRREIFQKVMGFANAEFDRFTSSSLITRTTNDITQIQMMMVMMIRIIFYAPIMAVGGLWRAIGTDRGMSWIIALAIGILACVISALLGLAMPKFKLAQTLIDRLNLVMRENLNGLQVIRAFNTQNFELARFDQANRDLTGVNLFVNRLMSAMMPTMMLLMNLVTVLVIWVGANRVAAAQMNVGNMMAYMQYAMQIMMAFLMMSFMFIMIPRASVSAGRIAEVLATSSSIADDPAAAAGGAAEAAAAVAAEAAPSAPASALTTAAAASFAPATAGGRLEFRAVSFTYPDAKAEALSQISFAVGPGETAAIIGSTGSGKSTLVNLIPRFYDVSAGQILIDGADIRRLPLKTLRGQLGYVPQKNVLFSGTAGSNLAYAWREAEDEEIWRAAAIAQAEEFIRAKPEGLASPIAQGGSNLSGGQRQRVSIGRALIRRPRFYIFDDSFSALDFQTDAALRTALKKETGQSAVLIVTQRISTAMRADRIIALDRGRIAGQGSHAQLMLTCAVYQEIALSQLSKEALA
ncbi:MAG: ABC transporter ATP-binding protein/permease [Peptococcaceae bacterium]|jgi:ATP-binding cassette subfamily B protein|nr:ABC transporter ATP-binding protein/permease [Peptococcaceae bacterium]